MGRELTPCDSLASELAGAIRRREITSGGTVAAIYRVLDELGPARTP